MRLHLLLILFFAGSVFALARIRRDVNETTIAPPTTAASSGNTDADSGDKNHFPILVKIFSKSYTLILVFIRMLNVLMVPFLQIFVEPAKIAIKSPMKIAEKLFKYLTS